MGCDMCGTEGKLLRAIIEGSEMTVCQGCAKYGKVIGTVRKPTIKTKKKIVIEKPEQIEMIIPKYGQIIKNRRKQLGLKQEDFAKKISEKESIVHKLETGEYKPTIKLAKKLERILNIKLIEMYMEERKIQKKEESQGFTIGDMIKIRKRKK